MHYLRINQHITAGRADRDFFALTILIFLAIHKMRLLRRDRLGLNERPTPQVAPRAKSQHDFSILLLSLRSTISLSIEERETSVLPSVSSII